MSESIPLAQRVRDAGDQAVPMLVDIVISMSTQAGMALEALGYGDDAPDLEEVQRRLGNIFKLLAGGTV